MDNIDYNFLITSIDYKETDYFTLVVFVLSDDNYKLNKNILFNCIETFNINKKSN